MSLNPDVIVAGGGAVGASAALGLAQQGREVLLLEAAEPVEPVSSFNADSPYELRVFAISYAAEQLFRYLGVWSRLQAKRLCAYTDMQVWDEGGSGQIHFGCEDIHHSHLGHIIENRVIVSSLWEAVAEHPGITTRQGTRISAVDWADVGERQRVTLNNGETASAALLLAADGANSQLRQLAGIGVRGDSYQQQGIVAVVATQQPHQHTAWQRFTRTGPIAFLPLANGQCSIVWSAQQARAEELLAMDESQFAQALTEAFEHHLGDVRLCSSRAAFPLRHQHAEAYCRPGLALLGDAAHVIHPLAGQGVNLGLLDVATLLEELAGAELPQYAALRRYARRRRHANELTLQGMSALHKAFTSRLSAWQVLRNRGLHLAGDIGPLRQQLAQRAAGIQGDIPRILKPG